MYRRADAVAPRGVGCSQSICLGSEPMKQTLTRLALTYVRVNFLTDVLFRVENPRMR